jgi:hypothetical protein
MTKSSQKAPLIADEGNLELVKPLTVCDLTPGSMWP